MSDNFDAFGDNTNPYPFQRQGSYGSFSTDKSFPIDYLLTTFASHELEDLTFAREIKQENIDFSLLLQREIDEDRVKDEIQPYLNSKDNKSIFFPPLLVAVLPISNEALEDYYPSSDVSQNGKMIAREYHEVFKLTHIEGSGSSKYSIKALERGKFVPYDILREPTKLEVNFAKGNKLGAKLVVIDGQHRLKALQEVNKSSPEALVNLAVPVCLLFPPNATLEYQENEIANSREVAPIREIFRQLFVDVNNTAERVGGHFNILLSETNISSIICRQFCSEVLEKEGSKGLALVEWNQKKHKLSTEITGKYSVTSIGVIDQALNEFIGSSSIVYEYLLNFPSDTGILDPDQFDSPHLKKAEWNRFSIAQKKELESRVKELVVPQLTSIFFEIDAFKTCKEIFSRQFEEIIKKPILIGHENVRAYQIAKDRILEYIPIPDKKRDDVYRDAQSYFETFSNKVQTEYEEKIPSIIRKNVFQKGLILAWVELIKLASKHQLDIEVATKLLIKAADNALKEKGKLFAYENSYTQVFIYNQTRIVATKDTVKGISFLLLGQFAIPELIQDARHILKEYLEGVKIGNFLDNLNSLSEKSLNNYMDIFSRKYGKYLEKSYSLAGSPFDNDEKDKLRLAHETKRLHQKEVRENIRAKSDVSGEFDILIDKHTKIHVIKVQQELISIFKLKIDIFGLLNGEGDDED